MKSKEGLEERLAFLFPDEKVRAERRPEYDERLQVELDVINQMGFRLLLNRHGVYPVVKRQ